MLLLKRRLLLHPRVVPSGGIQQVGSAVHFSGFWNSGSPNSGDVTTTLEVPADATYVLVGASTWASDQNSYMSAGGMTITKGGVDTAMTALGVAGDASASFWMAGLFGLALPDTGANKTLKYDWNGTATTSEKMIFSVTFWKGVDTASPVRDSDGEQGWFPGNTLDVPTMTAQSGDKIVAWIGTYLQPGLTASIDTYYGGLSTLEAATSHVTAGGLWATADPTGDVAVGATGGGTCEDCGMCAVVLKPA